MRYESVGAAGTGQRAQELVRNTYMQNSRVVVSLEETADVDRLYDDCVGLYPENVFKYHSGQNSADRLMAYAQLRELEKEGEGYLLIVEGLALENADLDASVLITSVCAPESLLRRAGRCNRRGDLANGQIVVLDDGSYSGRQLPKARHLAFLSQLHSYSEERVFVPEPWKRFIV
jgi:CRISPR/Cas system-associated endonuclease/helicase Cas3